MYFYVFSFSLSVAVVNLVIPYAFVFTNVFKLIRDDNVKMWPPAPSPHPFSDSGKSLYFDIIVVKLSHPIFILCVCLTDCFNNCV